MSKIGKIEPSQVRPYIKKDGPHRTDPRNDGAEPGWMEFRADDGKSGRDNPYVEGMLSR